MAENTLKMNNLTWPVGSVYYCINQYNTNTTYNTFNKKHPIVIFGGTWSAGTQITDSDGTTIYKFIRTA